MRASIIVAGLVIGAVLGLVGSFLPDGVPIALAWALSAMAFVVGWMLLAVRYGHKGWDEVAAGFILLTLGEILLFTSVPSRSLITQPVFGGASALYFLGLLLVSLPSGFAIWGRAAGVLSALGFGSITLMTLVGQKIASNSLLVTAAFILLDVAVVAWIVAVIGEERTAPQA